MTHHTEPKDGLWLSSFDDERWPGEAFFESRDEAIKHAVEQEHTYIGRVYNLSDDDVAAAFVRDWDDAGFYLGEQDEWSWCDDDLVREPTTEAREELHQLVKAWVERHSLREPRWRVEEIEGPFDWSTADDASPCDHVVTRAAGNNTMPIECLHCSAKITLALPVSVDEMAATTRGFVERHRACVKPAGGAQ